MHDTAPNPVVSMATAARPLLGLTVLIVEDSRFACDALRLICLRSGARMRRADCLRSARRHLEVYRPSVVVVDMGLPDGSGADLVAELARAVPRVPVVLGISGDGFAENVAMAAGADGFLEKPLLGVAAFQAAVLAHLPRECHPVPPRVADVQPVRPDRMALMDDFAHARALLEDAGAPGAALDYAAQFLTGLAQSDGDDVLAEAATALGAARRGNAGVASARAAVLRLLRDRLDANATV